MERIDIIDQMKARINEVMLDITGKMNNESFDKSLQGVNVQSYKSVGCVYIVKCDGRTGSSKTQLMEHVVQCSKCDGLDQVSIHPSLERFPFVFK